MSEEIRALSYVLAAVVFLRDRGAKGGSCPYLGGGLEGGGVGGGGGGGEFFGGNHEEKKKGVCSRIALYVEPK